MGKKKANATVVGRSIIRDRFGHGKRVRSLGGNSFLHTSDLNDGYDWGRLNLQSVTEQSNLDDFLTTAEMAGTEFTAEKLNITFVDVAGNSGLLTKDEKEKVAEAQDKNRNLLCIPRRPAWDETTTPEQLDLKERDAFLQWRRQLAQLQEVEHIVMTPYEKNLDFWRQLWRVIERSDVVVQIVDARNPLLFRSEDLEKYVTQVDDNKLNLLLINKADYLLPAQREAWADYFTKLGVRIAFWSALEETSVVKDTESDDSDIDAESDTEEEEMTREDILPRVENAEVICESQASKVKDISTVQEADVEHSHETKQCFRESDCDVISNEMNVDSTDRRNSQTDSSDVMDVDGAEHSGPVSEESSKGDNSSTQGMVMGDNSSNQDVVVGDNSSTQDVVGDNSSMQDIVVGDNSSTQDVVGDNSSMQDIVVGDNSSTQDLVGDNSSTQDMGDNSSTQNLVNRTDEWNSAEILSGAELISLLKNIHKGKTVQDDVTTIGMVGYPNVGKSSTINAILKEKKVPVSATPGRTKHFQTLFVDTDLMLCDCPGLVFPSFVSTKAQLVVSGILPVDQMREHIPPVSLVCDLIPRHVLETEYNINLPLPEECDDENIKPTAHEILSVYGYMRGYMTSKGIPDGPRSSRYILKDFVNGRLLYCHPPPGTSPEEFQSAREAVPKHRKRDRQDNKQSSGAIKPVTSLDHEFFRKSQCKAHSRGVHGAEDYVRGGVVPRSSVSEHTASPLGSQSSLNDKPWKKHNNRRKKDKLRRIHADLDK